MLKTIPFDVFQMGTVMGTVMGIVVGTVGRFVSFGVFQMGTVVRKWLRTAG